VAPDDDPRPGEPLPRAAEARIDRAKLINYALDPTSQRGRDKAIVFRLVLGIETADWQYLSDRILDALPHHPVSSIHPPQRPRQATTYGVEVPISGLNGRRAVVLSVWRMEAGRPQLTSVRVAKKRRRTRHGGSTL
jgi:hypothetical protein